MMTRKAVARLPAGNHLAKVRPFSATPLGGASQAPFVITMLCIM